MNKKYSTCDFCASTFSNSLLFPYDDGNSKSFSCFWCLALLENGEGNYEKGEEKVVQDIHHL